MSLRLKSISRETYCTTCEQQSLQFYFIFMFSSFDNLKRKSSGFTDSLNDPKVSPCECKTLSPLNIERFFWNSQLERKLSPIFESLSCQSINSQPFWSFIINSLPSLDLEKLKNENNSIAEKDNANGRSIFN